MTISPVVRMSMVLGSVACTWPAWAAADIQLKLDIPQPEGSRVTRPYVAVWIEKASDHSFAGNLALWYDQKKRNNAGTKWLKDMRDWWRAAGNATDLPLDGVSGATRAPGEQLLTLGGSEALAKLPAGNYEIVVEAAREHGGHDTVRLPLQWPLRSVQQAQAQGHEELGAVRLAAKP
jgi:hypothetical protein